MATIKEEWYIIVNPHAGSGKTMKLTLPRKVFPGIASLVNATSAPFLRKGRSAS